MHNFISYNNLKAWTHLQEEDPYGIDKVAEYFECISECDLHDRSCKQHCRVVLD